jgi:ankyrin repeat protein
MTEPGLAADRELPPLPSIERLHELWFDAARTGRDDVIPALLRAGIAIDALDAKGYSALVLASYHGHQEATALLLAEGAAPDGGDDARGNSALMGVAFKGHAEIARMLIAAGAAVDRRNGVGQTALMMAALFGQRAIVDMLLAAGADPELVDHAGNSARTVAMMQGNQAMADRLAPASGIGG